MRVHPTPLATPDRGSVLPAGAAGCRGGHGFWGHHVPLAVPHHPVGIRVAEQMDWVGGYHGIDRRLRRLQEVSRADTTAFCNRNLAA